MKLPKFNLRDLFWLVVVVAMGMGWLREHQHLIETLRRSDLYGDEINKVQLELTWNRGIIRAYEARLAEFGDFKLVPSPSDDPKVFFELVPSAEAD